MARIIVAFPEKEANRKIAALLNGAGYSVFRTCMTGNEVMRAFTLCQDGVLICAPQFPDRTADELAWDLGEMAVILVVARPELMARCEHPQIFRRPLPVSRMELLSAVDMLLQLHDHRMPRRGGDQKEIIRQAKEKLQKEFGMSEPDAHRAMQRYAMSHGMKMTECARKILSEPESAETALASGEAG